MNNFLWVKLMNQRLTELLVPDIKKILIKNMIVKRNNTMKDEKLHFLKSGQLNLINFMIIRSVNNSSNKKSNNKN